MLRTEVTGRPMSKVRGVRKQQTPCVRVASQRSRPIRILPSSSKRYSGSSRMDRISVST